MNESMPRSEGAAGGAKAQILEKAADLAQGAKEQARTQYDEKKTVAVGELGALASSLRRVVDEMSSSNPNNMSGKVVSTIADRLETFGQSLEGKDLDNVVRDVERFARRSPAAFLGGAVALGFLASRFLKSSTPYSADGDFYSSGAYGGYSSGRTDSAMRTGGFTGGTTPGAGAYGTGGSAGSFGSTGSTGLGTTGSGASGLGSTGNVGSPATGSLGSSGTLGNTGSGSTRTGSGSGSAGTGSTGGLGNSGTGSSGGLGTTGGLGTSGGSGTTGSTSGSSSSSGSGSLGSGTLDTPTDFPSSTDSGSKGRQ